MHLYNMQIHLYNVHSSKHVDGDDATGPPAIISQLENTTGRIVGILHIVSNKLREIKLPAQQLCREREKWIEKKDRQTEEHSRNSKSFGDT